MAVARSMSASHGSGSSSASPNHAENGGSSSASSSDTTGSRHGSSRLPRSTSFLTTPNPNQLSPRTSAFLRSHSDPDVSRVSLSAPRSALVTQSNMPLPSFFRLPENNSAGTSETDSDSNFPLLGGAPKAPWWREGRPKWWMVGASGQRRRRRSFSWWRRLKRSLRRLMQHPYFPTHPSTILLVLVLFGLFAAFVTLLLMHILNPDKEPLPWRAYCSVPSPYSSRHLSLLTRSPAPVEMMPGADYIPPQFPPDYLESLPPAGIFVGIFTMDSAYERRMLIRSTWASHPRSRNGMGAGDGGNGTSRTIVRFIIGQPQKSWERKIRIEMEAFNDIIVLPVSENMNSGKSHAFFTWASNYAWVPPHYFDTPVSPPTFTYSNLTSKPSTSALAKHDPEYARQDVLSGHPKPWVRPDFITKIDDDAFLMLAELESRLRVELYTKPGGLTVNITHPSEAIHRHEDPEVKLNNVTRYSELDPRSAPDYLHSTDPLIYWGYLVKSRFMAGESYALSWSIVQWIADEPAIRKYIKGAEDKQTAKWMGMHPRAPEIRWKSEHCWIYDHPKAGTVYSHGFLFPSEVKRVQHTVKPWMGKTPEEVLGEISKPGDWVAPNNPPTPAHWAYSSVSTFGVGYTPPAPDLTALQSIEALVEGSELSYMRKGSPITPEYAWTHREGMKTRYEDKRVGGTTLVHFIKQNVWFLETALALLEGAEESEAELQHKLGNQVASSDGSSTSTISSALLSSNSTLPTTKMHRQRHP